MKQKIALMDGLMERKDQTKRKRFIPVSKATEQGD
jgi:hypothetical protein